MTPLQIICIVFIAANIGFWLYDRSFKKRKSFNQLVKKAEDFINNADRTNRFHSYRATDLLKNVKRMTTNKRRERKFNQLVILWKSKFATFK